MNFDFLRANAEALLLMLSAAIMGGIAQAVSKVAMRKGRFSIFEIAGELLISSVAGMTAGLLVMDYAGLPLTFAVASCAGHMGTRFMATAERAINARLQSARGEKSAD